MLAGILEELDMHELCAVFAALVHEPRRGAETQYGRRLLGGDTARRVDGAIRRFIAIEHLHGFRDVIKPPDFSLTGAVLAWSKGGTIAELERLAGSDGGDVVRTLRMAIQMMRQLRSALSGDYSLIDRLAEAIVTINRDEVDAKRQFELG